MRLCFTAGAALSAGDAERFKARFGVAVYQLYGSTETGAVALSFEITPSDELDPQSVGRPLAHAKIRIFDEAGELLPTGSVGEIGIAAEAATQGYDGNPVATQNSFRAGYFFPGDLGRLDEKGRLTITGRKSLFINAGGNKIDPAEIEGVLAQHGSVKEAVVLGVPSSLGGEMIKAVVVSDREISREELLSHCSQHLAAFKLPKVIEFRAEIPKSPLGKVLRKYLL
jgi:long-chain acyl-CoA synthetase